MTLLLLHLEVLDWKSFELLTREAADGRVVEQSTLDSTTVELLRHFQNPSARWIHHIQLVSIFASPIEGEGWSSAVTLRARG